MPADAITHALKVLGGGTKMWVGILVIFVVGVITGAVIVKFWPSSRRGVYP
jgi:hypothetical protein